MLAQQGSASARAAMGVVATLGLLLVLLVPPSWLPGGTVASQPGGDKVVHATLFACHLLALRWSLPAVQLGRLALASLLLGAATELVQATLPWRSASWADLLADTIGIAIATLSSAIFRQIKP